MYFGLYQVAVKSTSLTLVIVADDHQYLKGREFTINLQMNKKCKLQQFLLQEYNIFLEINMHIGLVNLSLLN